ncbi:MAG: UvrD-helicase domain-containing protein [Lachnospiraceae bacterium]|nr:UvrD-helicase domain-containing protein [Lachnospiraceae bacterium]
MEKKWTDAQKSVIDTKDKNILVSAAAGSGKTAVLVERIIKMITDKEKPVDIDRLVVITFTRAAAAQMKQKISEKIEELIEKEPENALYRRQYHLLGNATISTIDSFCLNIVRSYFQKQELDPAFRVADETELGLIKSDCMDELMEKYHEEGNEDFYYLIEAYCGYKSDEKLTQYIFNLARKAEAKAWPDKWLDSLTEDYEVESPDRFDSLKTVVGVYDHIRELLKTCVKKMEYAHTLCVTNDGAPDYAPTIEEDEDLLRTALNSSTYSEIGEKLKNIKFSVLSRKKTGDPEIKEKVKTIRDKYKDEIKSVLKEYFFADTEEITILLQRSLPAVKCLVRMTKEYLELFSAKKREKNIIDFSDAEHFALDILWGETPEALELRSRYSEIIIDEYQDSNNVQEYIANAIAGKCDERPYVFTVGDVKQSIYKFRNACPELFVSKQKLYSEEKENGKLIILDNNFRSREEVLESTNAVFKHVMRESLGGIDYNDECSLKKGTGKQDSLGEDSPYKTEVLLLSKKLIENTSDISPEDANGASGEEKMNPGASEIETENEEAESEEVSENKRILEARLIVRRIKELVYNEKLEISDAEDDGKMRPVKFGDIVILLRTMKDWASAFSEVLEAEGIPVFSDETDGFFKSTEVRLVIDFLQILDNPRQDIPFAAVLHSCIGDMSEDELADIRIASKEAPTFYDAARFMVDDENDTERIIDENVSGNKSVSDIPGMDEAVNKLRKFFGFYDELHSFMQTATVAELIEKIYDVTGIYHYYSVMPDGEKRKANLDMLPGYAIKFESTSYSGLFGFIRYYERLKNHELDYGEAGAKIAGNSVRIMSIHKSKGLEFPVCIVAGLGKQFNLEDFKGDIFISSDNGIGIKYVDVEKRIKYPSFYHSVIRMRGIEEIIGEEMRLLYVAMTRAKDKLIMTGYTDKPNESTDYAGLFKSKSFVDFVYPVLEPEKEFFDVKVYSPETLMKLCGEDIINTGARDNNCNLNGFQDGSEGAPVHEETDSAAEERASVNNDVAKLEEEIVRARNARYRYEGGEALPVKLSVSELKHMMIEEEFGENVFEETREFQPGDKTLPDFMKTGEALKRGSDYGTLVHKCMQFMPMNLKDINDIKEFLSDMQMKKRLTTEEAAMMPVNKFFEFLDSEIADRIRKADLQGRFYREKQFMILVDVKEADPVRFAGSTGKIPVQGVIDAMFVEDGELVILDYKTDRALKSDPEAEEKLVKLYETQLDLYAKAAERLMGLKVKEKLLYSFSLGKTISV